MSDIQNILTRLAQLEQYATRKIQFGRVHEVKRNMVRVEVGAGHDGKPLLSPWIRTSNHHGFVSENKPMEKGQTVALLAQDAEMSVATVIPYSNSKASPLPEDADAKKVTRRIREPRKDDEKKDEAAQGKTPGTSGGGGSGMWTGGTEQEYTPEEVEEKKEDKEKDNYRREDFRGSYHRKGKMKHLRGLPDEKDKTDKGSNQDKEQSYTQVGDTERVQTDTVVKTTVKRTGKEEVAPDDGKHAESVVQQTAAKVLNKVGADAKVVHEAAKWLRQMKAGSFTEHTPDLFKRVMGSAAEMLHTGDKFEKTIGNVKKLMNAAGNFFTGGAVKHNNVNVGDDHKHWLQMGRAAAQTWVPTENLTGGTGGSNGGSGAGGVPPPPPLETPVVAKYDNVPFAYVQFKHEPEGPEIVGRSHGVDSVTIVGPGAYLVMLTAASYFEDMDYRVQVTSNERMKVDRLSPVGFTLTVQTGALTEDGFPETEWATGTVAVDIFP